MTVKLKIIFFFLHTHTRRYMMLILKEGEIYFFDRDHSCFKVSDLRFPQRKDLSNHLKDTLLDGVSSIILLSESFM